MLNESKGAKFCKPRLVPYALQPKVESALRKMEKDGVIERVTTSAVNAAPTVIVKKKDSDDQFVSVEISVSHIMRVQTWEPTLCLKSKTCI